LLGNFHHAQWSWFCDLLDGNELDGIDGPADRALAWGDAHGMCAVGAVVADLSPIPVEQPKLMKMKVNVLAHSHDERSLCDP
jgi:hypothetical protein